MIMKVDVVILINCDFNYMLFNKLGIILKKLVRLDINKIDY